MRSNLLARDPERGHGAQGAGWLGGLLRDLTALAAQTAPSVPSWWWPWGCSACHSG
ncbi:MAG: hypothetical protein ACRDSP_05835 [Pseudonocardiaceae bacterium]